MLNELRVPAILLFLLSCLTGCRDSNAPRSQPSSQPHPGQAAGAQPIKFVIRRTGAYRVPIAELRSLGWTLEHFSSCTLSAQGAPTSFWIDTSGREKAFCFFGKAIESRYTSEAVYILQSGGSRKRPSELPKAQQGDGNALPSFNSTVRLERNRLYQPLAELPVPWFWERLVAPEKKDLEIKLQGLSSGSCNLRVRLWAQTQARTSPDHHLRVMVNGVPAINEKWDGAGGRVIETRVPAGVFKEGSNTITTEAAGDTEAPADILFIDTLDISYPRRFVTDENDVLEFGGISGHVQVQASGVPVTVVQSSPEAAVLVLSAADSGFHAEVTHSYFAVGPKGFLRPDRIVPLRVEPDLREPALEADYIAIGSQELLAHLGPLLNSLKARKMTTLVVPAEAVFDQFNHGIAQPEAVRSFLRFTFERWKRHPRYLLLVGDATYDTLAFLHPSDPTSLPSFFTRTYFGGETVSDIEFTRLKRDSELALAVGRIPASTPDQVKSYVNKVVRFQASHRSRSRKQLLAVADPSDPSFRRDAEDFLDVLPDTYEKTLCVLGTDGPSTSPRLRGIPNPNPLLLIYFGHGSIRQLGRDGPEGANQARAFFTGLKAPISFHITCLSGFYVHPEVKCLAEELLLEPESAIVALLAPTSLTLAEHQRSLTSALAASLGGTGRLTMGEVVLQSLRKIDPDVPGQRDVRESFLLFGCPALTLEP